MKTPEIEILLKCGIETFVEIGINKREQLQPLNGDACQPDSLWRCLKECFFLSKE
jgi:hypothetical protein